MSAPAPIDDETPVFEAYFQIDDDRLKTRGIHALTAGAAADAAADFRDANAPDKGVFVGVRVPRFADGTFVTKEQWQILGSSVGVDLAHFRGERWAMKIEPGARRGVWQFTG